MPSLRPSEPVHPDVSADAGEADLLELSDDEVERELGVGVATPADHAWLEEAERRSVDESGAWAALSLPPPATLKADAEGAGQGVTAEVPQASPPKG